MNLLNLSPLFPICSLVILFSCSVKNSEKDATQILIVNHRGANRLAPENTYASAQKAIESGAVYIEVDVRRSKDGVYYNIHDRTLDRTTNGSGLVSETSSAVIDTLDAGSWFAHEFAGEKVPRMFEYLQWIKGKAKVYFDMKDFDLKEFIPKIYDLGMENDCFFWFSDWNKTREFRELYPDLALKVNASDAGALDSLKTIYHPQIIECSVDDLSDHFIETCHKNGMKIMPWIAECDMEAFRMIMEKNVDMVNLNDPDIFSDMARNGGVFKNYKLIAHKGGIVEGKYGEYDPASIREAIDQGYYMLEVDVRPTKDGVLIVNHDNSFQRFFNDPRRASDLTWDEVKEIRAEKGNYRPLLFEELCQMCSGKVKLMIDVKGTQPPEFYDKLGEIMEKYGLFAGSCFIDQKARKYFWGKTKFSIRPNEIDSLKAMLARREDIACHYFLFENGNRLASEAIKWCQQNCVTVVPTVNIWQYQNENYRRGAKRDIEFFKACGVTEFQIDSDFDDWLPIAN
ncbi:MAG: glycerophosphodiester phosphodiesterase family protein [Mangrovibacterium sp.]